MSDRILTCEGCGNYIDEEDLFCGNCGRERPQAAAESRARIEEGFAGFDCESCGASLTYDADTEGLRCSFCGSVSMKRQKESTGRIRAGHYLSFEVRRDDAVRAFREWIGRGFFRPFGIRQAARLVSMQAVYIPFWNFRADVATFYTGDSSRTPVFARADWCPVFGERVGKVEDLLVCASGSLSPREVGSLEPFDFSRKQPYERESIREFAVEDFGLGRRGARPRARKRLLESEKRHCAALIPGRSRNVHVNPLVTGMGSEPVLLPVWINAYRYRDEVFRFCINGQTGAVVGSAPFSAIKLILLILAIVMVVLVVLGLVLGGG